MAKKEITNQFKLQAPAGKATPAPPIGPALGANGVNPGQFITKFNAMSAHLGGKLLACVLTVSQPRSRDLELGGPPAAELLTEAGKAEEGSGEANKTKLGKATVEQCRKIAQEKVKDSRAFDVEAGASLIA